MRLDDLNFDRNSKAPGKNEICWKLCNRH